MFLLMSLLALAAEGGSAKGMIGWLVAIVLIGLVFWVVKTLVPMEGKFALVFQVMCGLIAFVCFIAFLLALLAFAGIPVPW